MIRQSDYENYDYRQFWQDSARKYEDSSERLAIRKLLRDINPEGKIFADLGCGYGRLFDEYKNCKKAVLVDYSLNNLRNARERILKYLKNDEEKLSDILFVVADVNRLPLKENIIDVCMSVRVIHHLEKPLIYFSEVARILKPEGVFLLEFANKRNLKNILKFISGRLKASPFNKKPLQIGETILDYHPKYIKSLLKESGFAVKKMISASNYRLSFLKKNISLKVLLFFENLYQDIFSFIDTGPSIFLKTVLMPARVNKNSGAYYKNNGYTNILPGRPNEDANKTVPHMSGNDRLCSKENTAGKTGNDLLQVLACPSCHGSALKIEEKMSSLICENCSSRYSIIDGIYVFKDK